MQAASVAPPAAPPSGALGRPVGRARRRSAAAAPLGCALGLENLISCQFFKTGRYRHGSFSCRCVDTGCAETCRCEEYEAKIKAYATQVKALRRGMADGVAERDAARAERDAARAERDAARAETAAFREEAEARLGEASSKIASLQAWAELQVGGAWRGGSPVPGAVAAVPSGSYVHDIMSAPPLAVRTPCPPRPRGPARPPWRRRWRGMRRRRRGRRRGMRRRRRRPDGAEAEAEAEAESRSSNRCAIRCGFTTTRTRRRGPGRSRTRRAQSTRRSSRSRATAGRRRRRRLERAISPWP